MFLCVCIPDLGLQACTTVPTNSAALFCFCCCNLGNFSFCCFLGTWITNNLHYLTIHSGIIKTSAILVSCYFLSLQLRITFLKFIIRLSAWYTEWWSINISISTYLCAHDIPSGDQSAFPSLLIYVHMCTDLCLTPNPSISFSPISHMLLLCFELLKIQSWV